MDSKKFVGIIVLLVTAIISMSCGLSSVLSPAPTVALFPSESAAPTLTGSQSTETTVPEVDTPMAATPTEPAVPQQNANPTPPPTIAVPRPAQPTSPAPAVPQQPGTMMIKIYLIAMEDNGASGPKIGCNDSVVAVNVEVPKTQGVLRAALTKLLSLKSKDYGESGFYNALYQSNLTIDSLAINNGEAVIKLSGQLASGGVCDDPRIIAQLEQTAKQFSTVERVSIFVNGKPIQSLLSGRG